MSRRTGKIQDDGVVDDQPNELDVALIVDESVGASSGQSDDQIANGNGDDERQAEQLVENTAGDQAAVEAEVTSSRPTHQRPPSAYLRECVRSVRALENLLETGCVGWFDTQAGQFWPTCLLPFPADANEENRVQLAQRYEIHVGWMNAKSHVFMPLARLLYPSDALEKRSIDLRRRRRYVAVHASEEKKTAKSGVRHQERQ